jgi:glutathione synthase/RimK-type ligase-like ATP-grasp enzyme
MEGGVARDGGSGLAAPMGVARLSKMMFDGEDLNPLWRELIGKYIYQRDDAAALMDLATVEQLFGNLEDGLARQREALELCRLYRSPVGGATPLLRMLAFAAPGDVGTNTPLEFLLEDSDVALTTLYVVPGLPLPERIPDHDVAFVAVGESDENQSILAEIERLLARWPKPVLNRPDRILQLSRERLFALLDGVPGLVTPATLRTDRVSLERLAAGAVALPDLLPEGAFPLIARPVGSHAGRGLAKLDTPQAVASYLAERSEDEFTMARFVDYRGADGLFRKYRIVFIEGAPYACHMAIADQWMIYYLNANMKGSAAKRDEEARFMAEFDQDFARRHGAALSAIAARVGLDYFGIDCAETADGDLLLFEADIAIIVHAMDSPAIFPYKPPQMRKLFAAFCAMLRRRGGHAPASAA